MESTALLKTQAILDSSAELFDPVAGVFVRIEGSMGSDRLFSAATLLRNGRVLLTGGYDEGMATSSKAWLIG
jgi:hypothetical protein